MEPEQWSKLVRYDGATGEFSSKYSLRNLKPDTKGTISLTYKKNRYRLPAARVALYLTLGRIPTTDEVVLFRNLNKDDYRFCNLDIVSKKLYSEIMNAYRNLNNHLKITPHPTDAFSYVVQWQDGPTRNRKVFADIVVARRFFIKMQLHYAKTMNKYLVFD